MRRIEDSSILVHYGTSPGRQLPIFPRKTWLSSLVASNSTGLSKKLEH